MNKPDQPRKAIIPTGKRPRTIRQQLEHDAWTNHGRLATRMAGRKTRRHCESGGGLIEPGPARNRRSLSRQDRTLLAVSLVLLLLLLSARAGMAQGQPLAEAGAQESTQESTISRTASNVQGIELWGIEFRGDDAPQFSVALDTDIKAEITGMVARIDVRQRFHNTGHAWSEAIYRFPLPAGAAVDRLLVDAGGRTVEGEIREKQEAKHRYEQARAEGMVAALVEQQRANQFEARLANIGPGEEITVSISFLAQVAYRDATFSLQIPHLYLADPDTRTDRVFQLDWKPDFGPDTEAGLMPWEETGSLLSVGSSVNLARFSSTATGWKAQLACSLATLLSAASLLWFSTPSHRVQAGGSPPPPVRAH